MTDIQDLSVISGGSISEYSVSGQNAPTPPFSVDAGNISLSGSVPTVRVNFNFVPAVLDLSISGQAPAVVYTDHRQITVGASGIQLSGQAPTLGRGFRVDAGALTLGSAAPLVVERAATNVGVLMDVRLYPAIEEVELSLSPAVELEERIYPA